MPFSFWSTCYFNEINRFAFEQRWEILKVSYMLPTQWILNRKSGRNKAPTELPVRKFAKKIREIGKRIDNTKLCSDWWKCVPKHKNFSFPQISVTEH